MKKVLFSAPAQSVRDSISYLILRVVLGGFMLPQRFGDIVGHVFKVSLCGPVHLCAI